MNETKMATKRIATRPQHWYELPAAAQVNKELYQKLSESGWSNIIKKLVAPRQSGVAWEMKAGQTCRIVVAYGKQVGDLNLWNLHNPKKERFFSGKTRQIHRTHLSTYDRLWSSIPWVNPMATITQDSMADYGFDEENCRVHDVIGTRCDPYTLKRIGGKDCEVSCHQILTKLIQPYGLDEYDVHDVFNIFMCSGFDKNTREYIIRGSPVEKGDYIEFVAEMDLLCALSACPAGDVSGTAGAEAPECYPLDVHIGQPADNLINEWKKQCPNDLKATPVKVPGCPYEI